MEDICKSCKKKFNHKCHAHRKYCSLKCQKNGGWYKEMKKLHVGKPSWNRGKPNSWSNGEKSNFWKGGISIFTRTERSNFMGSLEYKNWRIQVFKRDNYTCQICGKRGNGDIQANHIKKYIDYPELRTSSYNGITICNQCAYQFVNNHEKEWEPFFNSNLEERGCI
jgi:hypothetical protein